MSSHRSTLRHLTGRIATVLGLAAATTLAIAGPAGAHPADEAHLGGSLNGFLHPLLGIDHLAAMVAVGVIAALAHRRLPMWAIPASFVGGMVGGGVFGFGGFEASGIELVIAGSVVAFGLTISAARHLPLGAWLIPAVALVGAAHGNAHGLEAPLAAAPAAYAIGFVLATALLHSAGAMAGVAMRRFQLGQIVGGGAIALFGVTLLAG